MDSLITAAARALTAGDPLGALKRVALREDAPALALRGIAMAQLGDLARAKELLRSATRAFGQRETVARAKCIVAEAEVALAARDLNWPSKALDAARVTLGAHGDNVNAAHARYLEIRRLLLIGQIDAVEQMLADMDISSLPPALRTVHELLTAGAAVRRLHGKVARAAMMRAESAARDARIPALAAEVESAWLALDAPAARLVNGGHERLLLLGDVEDLLTSDVLVVDAIRGVVRDGRAMVSLASRPVLFALARAMGEAWPDDVPRDLLLTRAFGAKFIDASHRARLRVEIARLRNILGTMADLSATKRGFVLTPLGAREIVVLTRLVEEEHGAMLALLSDGQEWSSSAMALALGASQRTIQRAIDKLAAAGKVQSFGRARSLRWMATPMPGFTTTLLLPAPLPIE